MNAPLEVLKKGLLQQNRLTPHRSLSPTRLRERYLVSIHVISPSDVVHEFMYIPSITPPLAVQQPSPERDKLPIALQTSSADFKQVEPSDDNVINDIVSDMEPQ